MNKSAIKKFATAARRKLMDAVTQKAYEVGITRNEIKEVEVFQGGFRVNGRVFKEHELKQREELINRIRAKGFDQVVEEVAYTWFNRFIALRFMEVNDYLPTGVRVLSSLDKNRFEPDIVREALNLDLDIDHDLVYQYQDNNDTEGLYKYLLIKQCNELARIMPGIFEQIADYTELLLPDYLLTEGSVIRDLVETIDEDDFKEQVEIIGWLYQYYIAEKKDQVFANLKKNIKITKENIPAATQLFTPEWIVKYMVENSLGRLWLESHPNDELKAKWKYYLEEAEQEPEVQKQLEALRNPDMSPEDIKVLDPAMGSGHILVYAFDVLYDIYLSAGYSERDIPRLILEKNLYGLDICDRAGQLAYFALMMRARGKNRRIFREKLDLNVCSIQESNGIPGEAADYFAGGDKGLKKDFQYLIDVFHDAKEYGSILNVEPVDFDALEKRLEEIREQGAGDLFTEAYRKVVLEKVPALIKQARIMSGKYEIVVANPPYMGRNGMNIKMLEYTELNYPNSKGDLFAIFIERALRFVVDYVSMITMQSWMYLPMFKKIREKLFKDYTFYSIVHLGSRAFEEIKGEKVKAAAFVLKNKIIIRNKPTFIRLTDYNNHILKEKEFFNTSNYFSSINQHFIISSKKALPSYEISNAVINIINNFRKLSQIVDVKRCLATGKDEWFIRNWTEVNYKKIWFYNKDKARECYRWFPVVNGGDFRKWYGNNDNVLYWEDDGKYIKECHSVGKINATLRNLDYFFVKSLTYTYTSMGSGKFNVRYIGEGFASLGVGPIITLGEHIGILGYLNSVVFSYIYQILFGKTSTFETGSVGHIPCIEQFPEKANIITQECIDICKRDWDSFETSWDFKKHPFLIHKSDERTIEKVFKNWSNFTEKQFTQLKLNEEELNRIFIEIYGLQDELTPEVDDKDITISKADRERDIKSFISYAVGCMFGRYSLDEEGLVYAGGEFDPGRYKTFKADEDNVIPILDDVYFEEGEDIVGRFVEFVKVTFGEETLEENLDYIAETLKKKTGETSRQTIRRYFLNDFYKDHVKTYKKRPIYWLFDSGKHNGFKALIYMHRYDPYTVARVRTDYLHKVQKKYEAEMERLEMIIQSDVSQAEKNKARKKKEHIARQMKECMEYDQVIAHVANQKIEIDLDDGVKVNYAKFQGVEIPRGEGKKPLKADLLAKI
jgi:hypothetical protein